LSPLDLRAVTGGQQHEGLGIARLGRLAGAGVGAFRAIVLGRGVDPVALLELVGLHPRHVVLDDLRGLAHVHALSVGRNGWRQHDETEGSRKRGSSECTTIHGSDLSGWGSRCETVKRKFAAGSEKVTRQTPKKAERPRLVLSTQNRHLALRNSLRKVTG